MPNWNASVLTVFQKNAAIGTLCFRLMYPNGYYWVLLARLLRGDTFSSDRCMLTAYHLLLTEPPAFASNMMCVLKGSWDSTKYQNLSSIRVRESESAG